jgi:O-antigen ligase
LSKTAIIAFVIAESWYLLQNKAMTRRAKFYVGAATLLVVVSFWGVLSAYIDIYANTGSGDQIETLTGRTVLWAVAISMGLEKPWFGHGIYSFKALIPAFGDFEAVHAHNEFLQQFFEYGLVGVVIVGMIYWSFFRQARRAPPDDIRTLSLTLLIFVLVRGLTDTTNFGLSCPLWLLATLTVCLARPGTFEAEQ